MASEAGKILKTIEDEEIEWVDLRFTDPKGKWQHLSMVASSIDEDMLTDGFMFDGSSIAGWKAINESRHDPQARPRRDLCRPVQRDPDADPVSATSSSPAPASSTAATRARPPPAPRPISRRAASATPSSSGPEAEFFMFDDVRFEDGYAASGFKLDDIELPTNTGPRI